MAVLLAFGSSIESAHAAPTDISNIPLASTDSPAVKPNVMLLMDTSGSMAWGHMPDEVESVTGTTSIGYKAAQCNVLYYNRNQTYSLPKLPSGAYFAPPTFFAAPYSGYAAYQPPFGIDIGPPENTIYAPTVPTDLSNSFKAYDDFTLRNSRNNDTPQQAYYYYYTGAQTLNYASAPCTDADSFSPNTSGTVAATGGGTWTRVKVGTSSGVGGTDETLNFAIWYSFYRTRINLIKSAASLAFTPLTDSFRVGFITVKPKDNPTDASINPNKYLQIQDFSAPQRTLWFDKLFSQVPSGSSPTREGLARVGRHYAGRQDGINSGMVGDPVQYSCQQNFTIMTTDGYWNDQAETPGPGGGPTNVDGTAWVGEQDGNLSDPLSPRPIWDGLSDSKQEVTDNTVKFAYAPCGTYFWKSTAQIRKSTTQLTQASSQMTTYTTQALQSTTQNLTSTSQLVKNTLQHTKSTTQITQSTSQWTQNTDQLTKSTSQTVSRTTQLRIQTSQWSKSTSQLTKSTSQTTKLQTQQNISTLQTRVATSQTRMSTQQWQVSTSQIQQSTQLIQTSTSQLNQSTAQVTTSYSQVRRSTSQQLACDANTELCTPVPVGSCSAGGNITCETLTTGPTLVASCTPASAADTNSYTTTTCATTGGGPTPVPSCSPSSANSGNGYTTTTCNTVTSGPTPVSYCLASGATSGNAYTATTCSTSTTGPTASASCTPAAASAGNGYLATTCTTTNGTPFGVSSCTPVPPSSGNGYVATLCNTVNTGPTPVASCASSAGNSGNSWLTTTCTNVLTGPTPVGACSNVSPTAGNSYTTTSCSTVTTGPTPSPSCSIAAASAGNSWTSTSCPNVSTGPTPTGSCTVTAASSGNAYTATTCPVVTSGPTGTNSCSVSGPTSGNGWVNTTCPVITTGPTGVAACSNAAANGGNSWTTTTCNTVNTGPTFVASCANAAAAAGNSYTQTTCVNNTTGPTNTGTCTNQAASAGNSYTTTTCSTLLGAVVYVNSCVNVPPDPTTGQGIQCTTIGTGPTGVASCSYIAPTAGNNYTTTTCATLTTGPTFVASCTPAAPSSGNAYVHTTCSQATSGPTPVASCTPAAPTAGNSFVSTTCATNTTVPVGVASCTPQSANSGNAYTQTNCVDVTTSAGVASCSPITASSGNSWTATTCATVATGPSPSAACTPISAASGNQWTATTCSTNNTGPTAVASCTPSLGTAGNGYTVTTCSTNNSAVTGVQTCTPIAASSGNAYTATVCAPVVIAAAGTTSCTPQVGDGTNGWKTVVCNTVNTGPTPVPACVGIAPDVTNGYTTTTCDTVTTGPTVSATCTPVSAVLGPNNIATTCVAASGQKISYNVTTTVKTTLFSGTSVSKVLPTVTTVGSSTDLDGVCYAPDTSPPALPSPNPQTAGLTAGPAPSGGCSAWPCTVNSSIAGAQSVNSLADVAQYYYRTDLRKATDWPPNISTNDVPSVGTGPEDDSATWQHMTTFSVALGVSGQLQYRPDYKSGTTTTGDFAHIRTGTIPLGDTSGSGAVNWPLWPDPTLDYSNKNNWNDPRSIDDFWHAAVDGRGQYFSAGNPTSVIQGLNDALSSIKGRIASGSAAGTSNLQPVTGDNFVYLATYKTADWFGDVEARDIDLTTGNVLTTVNWSAQPLLDAMTHAACDTRNIYLIRKGVTGNLVDFSWNTRTCDVSGAPTGAARTGLNVAEQANFAALNVSLLSQYPTMTDGSGGTADQRTPAVGSNMVNFLRGQTGLQGFIPNDASKLYRNRLHVLGDIVGGQPVYVKGPFANYLDTGYDVFKSTWSSRTPMVYVAANDGMLHAFYAGTGPTDPLRGQERWAVIPTSVLPKLYKLADNNYKNVHEFFVDGTPTVGDVYDPNAIGPMKWKTVLVGGLNAGGKGYYALDVTDPSAPTALWEFNWSDTCFTGAPGTFADCHVGYTFGKPVISKLADGRWAVFVTSGYNNLNAPAKANDGQGFLYVLDAVTGELIYKISTGYGDSTNPSGLAQISNFVSDSLVNNSTLRVYGGDLGGNLWRFDVNDNIAPSGREATLVGQALAPDTTPQPITVKPELAEFGGQPMIFFGTGKFLGVSDIDDKQVQSVYGMVDKLAGIPVYPNLRAALAPLTLTQTGSGSSGIRTVACAGGPLCASKDGWIVDMNSTAVDASGTTVPSGERVNVDMKLQLGTLVFGSNVPIRDACVTGGYSWLNYVSYASGLSISTSAGLKVSEYAATSLIVGLTVIQLPDGTVHAIKTMSDATVSTSAVPIDTPAPVGKRVSWREIVQ